MSLEWNHNELCMSQNRQIERLIEYTYKLMDCKQTFKTAMEAMDRPKLHMVAGSRDDLPDAPHAELVCALLFIARCTRPDNILFSVTLLCIYPTNDTAPHFKAALRICTKESNWIQANPKRQASGNTLFPTREEKHNMEYPHQEVSYFDVVTQHHGLDKKQSDVSLSTFEAEYKTQTYAFEDGM